MYPAVVTGHLPRKAMRMRRTGRLESSKVGRTNPI